MGQYVGVQNNFIQTMIYDDFVSAIAETNLVELTFNSKEKGVITRICAPMDFGPWKRSSSPEMRYHFIDLDSSSGVHPLSITAEQILQLTVLDKKFKPENIVNWVPEWHIARDWGVYS